MSGFYTKEVNNNGDYEITFYTENREDFKKVQSLCRELIGNGTPISTEGDLISREDLIRMITIECNPYGAPTIDYESGLRVLEIIDRAPTIYPICFDNEGLQGKWIPVSERLPEEKINPYTTDFDEVLCTTDWGEVQAYKFGTPILHHKPHFWLAGSIMDEHIIAWQPLPEPYKKGDEEE